MKFDPSTLVGEGWGEGVIPTATNMDTTAIRVENLSKCYQIYDQPRDRLKQFVLPRLRGLVGLPPKQYYSEFWALKDVSFQVKKGETVGIIGRNGSGKSTLLQLICGTLNPTSGTISTNGRIAALLELGSGFNPEFSGRENVYMSCALLGLKKEEVDNRFDEIVAFADIGDFIEQPVKTYSSGMFVRLAFAVNVISSPDIMVVDEALAVGDMNFQAKCMTALTRFQERGGTVLFVSHDVAAIKSLCQQAVYLEHGHVVSKGPAPDVAERYIKTMREEMNKDQQRVFLSPNTLMSYKLESVNDRIVDESKIVFKRSIEFDKRVATFRYGSGDARISFVEMLSIEGRQLSTIGFNQEVIINIFFESHLSKEIAVYFGILDEKKNQITGAGLRQLGLPLIHTRSGERYVVSYSIKLPLEEGNYSVMAQLSQPIIPDQTAEFIDVVDNAIVFRVERRLNARLWAKVYLFPTCKITKLISDRAESAAH